MTEEQKKAIDTRRGMIEKAAAAAAAASLAGDTEQPPEFCKPLTDDERDSLTSPLSVSVRRRIQQAGRSRQGILPILQDIHANAKDIPSHALYEYVLDITDYYDQGTRLNPAERELLIDLIRHWPDETTRVRMIDRLEERAPAIADLVAAQEVAQNE